MHYDLLDCVQAVKQANTFAKRLFLDSKYEIKILPAVGIDGKSRKEVL